LEEASEVMAVELEAALVVVAVVLLVALVPQDPLPAMDLQEEVDLTKRESAIQPIATRDECVSNLQSTVTVNTVACQATYPSARPGKPETND
jgi:hypothetical protein